MEKKLFKPFIFSVLSLVGILFFIQLFFLYQEKPQAVAKKVTITYVPGEINVKPGEVGTFSAILIADDAKISAVDLTFAYPATAFLKFGLESVSPASYFTDKLIEKTETVAGEKRTRYVFIARKNAGELESKVMFNFRFRAEDEPQYAEVRVIVNQSQVVGTFEGKKFELQQSSPLPIFIGSKDQISNFPTGTISPPSGTGSASLKLKLRFQGINKKPAEGRNNMKVVVKVNKGSFTATSQEVNFTSDDNGIWSNSSPITFDKTVPAGSNYKIFVKGEKHIQKKICDPTPTETAPGTYRCTIGKINLVDGLNTFDFSGIVLLAGDLPKQDGIVNSYDVTLVKNLLGKSDPDSLISADINKDGVVNTQDYSLIIFALSTKWDEE